MTAVRKQRKYNVNLTHDHARCEMNFHKLLALLPGLRDGVDSWSFSAGVRSSVTVNVEVLDAAPYTTTIAVEQDIQTLCSPRIVVRLYHDVNMAEIVSWDNHRHWKPQYPYPNTHMYHPDEKRALNDFLGEWLAFCLKQGIHGKKSVIKFSNSTK